MGQQREQAIQLPISPRPADCQSPSSPPAPSLHPRRMSISSRCSCRAARLAVVTVTSRRVCSVRASCRASSGAALSSRRPPARADTARSGAGIALSPRPAAQRGCSHGCMQPTIIQPCWPPAVGCRSCRGRSPFHRAAGLCALAQRWQQSCAAAGHHGYNCIRPFLHRHATLLRLHLQGADGGQAPHRLGAGEGAVGTGMCSVQRACAVGTGMCSVGRQARQGQGTKPMCPTPNLPHPPTCPQFERDEISEAQLFASFFSDGRPVDGPALRQHMVRRRGRARHGRAACACPAASQMHAPSNGPQLRLPLPP